MPIVLNKVERMNPSTRTKKWYLNTKRVSLVSESTAAKQISDETTLNRKEAEMALAQFEKVLLANLLASNSVKPGDWGSFHITCSSTGANTKEELTAHNIKRLNIRFTPGKALKEAIEKAVFVFAEDLTAKQ